SFEDGAGAVDVALDDMAAEPVTQTQGPFQIDAVAGPKFTEVGAAQRFRPGLEAKRLTIARDHGQAAAVDGDALAERQLASQPRFGDDEVASGAIGFDAADRSQGFDEAGEHGRHWRYELAVYGSSSVCSRSRETSGAG